MTPVLASILMAVSPQSPPSDLLTQIGIQRTGTNGYEEYLDAGTLVNRVSVDIDTAPTREDQEAVELRIRRAEAQIRAAKTEEERWEAELELSSARAELQRIRPLVGTTLIQRQRALVEGNRQIWELVRKGNAKVVRNPRSEYKWDTLIPELAAFRKLIRFARQKAAYEFASGRGDLAVETLTEAYIFTSNVPASSLIFHLSKGAMFAILHRALDQWLPSLPSRGLDRLEAAVAWPLGTIDALTAYENEMDFVTGVVSAVINDPHERYDLDEDAIREIRALSDAQRKSIVQLATARFRQYRQLARQIFSQPESTWPTASIDLPSDKSLNAVISEMLMPAFLPGNLEARLRAQARVGILSIRAVRHRWETGSFPRQISDFVSAEDAKDPLSGKSFELISRGTGIEIRSPGVPSTGPIGLTYRPPTPEELAPPTAEVSSASRSGG